MMEYRFSGGLKIAPGVVLLWILLHFVYGVSYLNALLFNAFDKNIILENLI